MKSPKEVVEEFWELETNGERLTPEGWNHANRFFVHATPPPANKVIRVINVSSVWDPIANDFHALPHGTAEIEVGVLGIWGIDSKMRFFVASKTMKSGVLYKVARTSLHWELGTDGTSAIPVGGPMEWRISERGNTIWLGADAAIRTLAISVTGQRTPRSGRIPPQRSENSRWSLNMQRTELSHSW